MKAAAKPKPVSLSLVVAADTETVVISSCSDDCIEASEASLSRIGMISLAQHQANSRKRQTAADAAAAVTAPAPTVAAAPGGSTSIVWQEGLVGWKNTQGRLVANSENWVLQRKAKDVASVEYADLRSAMHTTHVPGVDEAKNKDDLIRIMCKFNCVYSTATLPMISLGRQMQSAQDEAALPAPPPLQNKRAAEPPISAKAAKLSTTIALDALNNDDECMMDELCACRKCL